MKKGMKKLVSLICVLVMVFTLYTPAFADEAVSEQPVVADGGNTPVEEVVVPSTYNGLPVKEITASVFSNNSSIVSVSFPDSIETIASGSFKNCTNLEKIIYVSVPLRKNRSLITPKGE